MAFGILIKLNSKHPSTRIMNTARGCIKRMFDISDKICHKEIKKEITEMLTENDFPKILIKNLFKKICSGP